MESHLVGGEGPASQGYLKLIITTIKLNVSMKKNHLEKQKEQIKTNRTNNLSLSEENFKIYLRVKPLLTADSQKQSIHIINNKKVEVVPPPYSCLSEGERVYNYEEVFDGGRSNQEIFDKTMLTPINNALNGFNSTIFIYGMTGAGKTYTMFGNSHGHSFNQEGLVSMAIDYMFDQIYQEKNVKSQVSISFFQIYNENIRDLLQQSSQNLVIMEDPVRGVMVNDLMEIQVEEIQHTKEIISNAVDKRAMNATKSNEISSRSHAILQFALKRYTQGENDEICLSESKFFMIDLAGNEKTSQNEAKRFVEGVNINKSLLTLGKCFNILAERKNAYVPFRDSKLTRILKESLGGNSKTVMIACVSPQRKFYEETLNTLKYSSVAKKIKNKGIKNNTKIVSKSELPCDRSFINPQDRYRTEEQVKINSLMVQFMDLMSEKLKIQRIQDDLEASRHQNEKMLSQEDEDLFRKNIFKINEVSQRLNIHYEENLKKADQVYSSILEQIYLISSAKKSQQKNLENQRQQIIRLNEVILQQKNKLRELQEVNMSDHFNSINQVDSVRKSENISHLSSTFSQIKENKRFSNIDQTFRNQTQNPYKNLKIDVSLGDESQRSLNMPEPFQKRKSEDKRTMNKLQKQIVINLNQNTNPDREEFLKKLKDTEKRAKRVSNSEISLLLEEQENKKYELGNVEMSMLRKLRFFQREKSLQKSNSLGGISLRSNKKNKM